MATQALSNSELKISAVLPMESSAATIQETAIFAEELGLHGVWVYENLFFRGAFSTLGAIASATQRIHLGVGTVSPYGRNPAILAMEAAALQQISDGRFTLGLGTSPLPRVEQMGVAPSRPLATIKESVQIIKDIFRGGIEVFQGARFEIKNVHLGFELDIEAPPVYIGAMGDKMMSLGGEVADGTIFSTNTPLPFLKRSMERIKVARSAADRQDTDFHTIAYVPYSLSHDASEARDRLKPWLSTGLARMDGRPSAAKLVNDDNILDMEQISSIAEGLRSGEHPNKLISDEVVDALCIAGTPEQCAEKLHAYHQAGIREIGLFGFGADQTGLEMLRKAQSLVPQG